MRLRNVLMLGATTSLGERFVEEAEKAKCRIFNVASAEMRNEMVLKDLIPDRKYDWVVNCLGRNRLHKIGEARWFDKTTGLPFTNSLLVENVMPIFWVINELVRRKHPGARVLSVASQTYRIAQTNTAIYCASKAALVQLSRTMARELAERGWVINCLAPGKIVDTRMADLTDAQVQKLRGWTTKEAKVYAYRNIPMRRFTDRAEVVQAMFAMLVNMPDYVNGTCVDMTGGA